MWNSQQRHVSDLQDARASAYDHWRTFFAAQPAVCTCAPPGSPAAAADPTEVSPGGGCRIGDDDGGGGGEGSDISDDSASGRGVRCCRAAIAAGGGVGNISRGATLPNSAGSVQGGGTSIAAECGALVGWRMDVGAVARALDYDRNSDMELWELQCWSNPA